MEITNEEYLQNRKIIIDPCSPLMDAPEIYHKFSGLELNRNLIISTIKTYFEIKYKFYEAQDSDTSDGDEDISDLILNKITVFSDGDLKVRIRRYETFNEYVDRVQNGVDIEEDYEITDKLVKEFNPNYNKITWEYKGHAGGFVIDSEFMKHYFETVEFKDMASNAEPFYDELNSLVLNYYAAKNESVPNRLYMHLVVYGDGAIRISEREY